MGKLAQRLSDAARSGVYRTAQGTEVEDAVRATRLDLARVDLGGADGKEALLERIALALGFPAWFGGNWDALEDCLGDLDWRAGDGHVFLFSGYEDLPADDLGVLLDVLAASAAYWAERGKPFFAVFLDARHALALPELFRARSA
ncbi:MAG: barstar family protein [Betaproteobacteria bacterium]|nr:barstar family protein [Betaproteobacteria bacterium]MDH4322952.1 barstar family protein [Betaproteobacteria bacterium]